MPGGPRPGTCGAGSSSRRCGRTRVTHTYDWTGLTDERRIPTARATTAEKLTASLDRLAALAENEATSAPR